MLNKDSCHLMEVSHWRKLSHDWPAGVEAAIECCERLGCTFLIVVHAVHITHELIRQVIHNEHFVNFAKLREFLEDILVEFFKVILEELQKGERVFRVREDIKERIDALCSAVDKRDMRV